MTRHMGMMVVVATAAASVILAGVGVLSVRAADQKKDRYFEMRTYHTNAGKMDALNARFRDHTNRLFQKHGIEMVGYWQPVDQRDTLIYILAYPNREAREASWKAFQDDADWKTAKAESERGGTLVAKVDQVFMTPTDYSPIK